MPRLEIVAAGEQFGTDQVDEGARLRAEVLALAYHHAVAARREILAQIANRQLLAVVQGLSLEQLHTPLAIGQGSVWRTLTHLLAAEFVWLGTLQGDDQARLPGDVTGRLPGNQAGPNAIVSLGELTDRWRSLDQAWDTYLAALDDDTLDQTVYRVSTSSGAGKRWGVRTSDVLLHVCTHAQYTTAQLVNMLRQAGQTDLPDVMLISMAREATA